jgi:hypothetical protein
MSHPPRGSIPVLRYRFTLHSLYTACDIRRRKKRCLITMTTLSRLSMPFPCDDGDAFSCSTSVSTVAISNVSKNRVNNTSNQVQAPPSTEGESVIEEERGVVLTTSRVTHHSRPISAACRVFHDQTQERWLLPLLRLP